MKLVRKLRKKRIQTKEDHPKSVMESNFDSNGSYTGTPVSGDVPVQDADDL